MCNSTYKCPFNLLITEYAYKVATGFCIKWMSSCNINIREEKPNNGYII
ncbi:hypothetical protein SAMN04487770_12245 [Butyrivibrio sp. ob235]|nr:hypothetical protein SAMN04487770_12245 [Butyrivibrio sp. ob235]